MNITTIATSVAANSTVVGYELDPLIEAFKILVTCILALVMFGMGCAVDYSALKENFKRPIGICIGLLCQIFLMPLLAYSLIKATGMSGVQALTFMSVGCSPGGLFSNIITLMVDGDMPLSIALTTCTNILAFGTVPFWLYIYTLVEDVGEDIRIPYSSLGISLASLVVPIVLGLLFRLKFPKVAKYLSKGSAIFGFIFLIVIIIAMLVRNEVPLVFSVDTLVPIIVLPVVGMAISYSLTLIPKFGLKSGARRTIAIETSIQNGNLSNNIVFLTYAHNLEIFKNVVTIPLLYSVAQSVYNILLVCVYRVWLLRKKYLKRKFGSVRTHKIEYQNIDL